MSFSNTAETAVLNQVFVGTALAWNANTDLWIALHTADPGEAGTAVTSEAAYPNYARAVLTRATDFTVSGNQVSNANQEAFNQANAATTEVLTWASIVTTASGAGTIIARAQLTTPITMANGVQPIFAANALVFTLD